MLDLLILLFSQIILISLKISYKRYLINEIRKEFNLDGVPIRMDFRGSDNPYNLKK